MHYRKDIWKEKNSGTVKKYVKLLGRKTKKRIKEKDWWTSKNPVRKEAY